MILNTPFQIALSIDEFCPQDRVIEKVGGDRGGEGESGGRNGATPTTAVAADDVMSGRDVVAEIQQNGGTAGGDTLTAKVSKLLIRRLFVCLVICFVCLLCELSVLLSFALIF